MPEDDKFRRIFDQLFGKAGEEADPEELLERVKARFQPKEDSPSAQQATEILVELTRDTTDEGVQEATLRALGIYRSIVRHVKAGGTVKFVAADGVEKTLKVRLK